MSANPAVSRTVAIVQGDAFQRQIQAALPRNVDMQRFARIVLTALNSSDALQRCSQQSVLKACLQAAQDGLLPDGREGAIVPFKGEAVWQPMVWGLVKLVRQSGELLDMGSEIIRSADKFERWVDESGPHFRHEPNLAGEGDPLAVYAYARTKDGGFYIEVIGWKEILKFKALSAAGSKGPWGDWTDQMAKVRAVKRLCRRLPMSSDVADRIDEINRRDIEETAGTEAVNPLAAINQAVAAQQTAGAPQLTDDPSPTLNAAPRATPSAADDSSLFGGERDPIPAEQVEAALRIAKTGDNLDEAGDLIGEVADEAQRVRLTALYRELRANFE